MILEVALSYAETSFIKQKFFYEVYTKKLKFSKNLTKIFYTNIN